MIFYDIDRLLKSNGVELELGKIILDMGKVSTDTYKRIKDFQKLANECGSFVAIEEIEAIK